MSESVLFFLGNKPRNVTPSKRGRILPGPEYDNPFQLRDSSGEVKELSAAETWGVAPICYQTGMVYSEMYVLLCRAIGISIDFVRGTDERRFFTL